MMKLGALSGLLLFVFVSACGALPAIPTEININVQAPTQDVNQIVAATFAAMTVQAAQPALQATPASQNNAQPPAATTGGISGSFKNYPVPNVPALHIVAFQVGSQNYYYVITLQKPATYQVDNLPPGKYHVMAYPIGDDGVSGLDIVGAYDQYYLCGMHQGCIDTTLVDVEVTAGHITSGIDFGNWFVGPEEYPANPIQQGGTDNIPTNTPPGGQSGSIAGDLSYPSSSIPAQAIVAYHVGGGPNDYYYTTTQEGQNHYQLNNLPPGQYTVVAYVLGGGLSAGYSQMVPCGLQAGCNDHSLIVVTVNAGAVTNNVNPQDWYAPDGAFPAYPLP